MAATATTRRGVRKAEAPDLDDLLSPKEAGKLLGIAPRTLRMWREDGRAIPFVRLSGKCCRYRRRDIEAFIEKRTIGGNGDD